MLCFSNISFPYGTKPINWSNWHCYFSIVIWCWEFDNCVYSAFIKNSPPRPPTATSCILISTRESVGWMYQEEHERTQTTLETWYLLKSFSRSLVLRAWLWVLLKTAALGSWQRAATLLRTSCYVVIVTAAALPLIFMRSRVKKSYSNSE